MATCQKLEQDVLTRTDKRQLVEILQGMMLSQKLHLKQLLRSLWLQLLRWQHQPQKRCNDWVEHITELRYQLLDHFTASPALKDAAASMVFTCYQEACTIMSTEDHFPVEHLPLEEFPQELPFSLSDILDLRFFPT